MRNLTWIRGLAIGLLLSVAAAVPSHATPLPLTMDRATDVGFWGADFSYVDFEADVGYALQLEGYGQFALSEALGIYGALPLQIASVDFGGDEDTSIKFGNMELGVSYALPGGIGPTTALIFRGGLVLPTFRIDNEDDPSVVFGGFSGVTRLGDLVRFFPETTSVRASATLYHEAGMGYVRGDAGLDVALHTDEDLGDEPDPIGRLSVGGGFNLEQATIGAELVSVILFGDTFDDENVMHTLAIGGRYTGSSIQPYGAFVFPIASDPLEQIVDLSIRLGVTGTL